MRTEHFDNMDGKWFILTALKAI